jgi:peptide/nickel transport system substrate-binding protein
MEGETIMYNTSQHLIRFAHTHHIPAIYALVLLQLTLFLAACGGGNTAQVPQSKYGGNISVGLDSDVVTLDPLQSSALVDRQVMLNIYDTLVTVDQQGNILPDLATSWLYQTPVQLILTLRTDVMFQDGTPLNADAVVFNINRILSTPSSPRYSEISSVKSAEAIDATHVLFHLKKPFSPLLATFSDRAGMILSPAAVQKAGANLGNAPVNAGSGPFEFSEWIKGDHLTIKRNPHYWQKDAQGNTLPYLASIRYRPFTDANVEFSNLQTGTIDVADTIAPNDVATAKSDPDLTYKQEPGLSFYGIMLNTKVAPFTNVAVRRAVEWGVNRQEIVSSVFKNTAVVAQGPIPPNSWAYDSHFAPYTYDVSKAKAELAQAGKADGISFTLIIASGSPLTAEIAQFLQSELQPAGITVNIKQETFATELSDTETHNFQAALQGWSGRLDPDGNLYTWFHTGGGNNDMQYSDPQVDALLDAARATSDQKERATDYQQAEQSILQDAPYVFLYHLAAIQATTSKVQNFTLQPTTILSFTSVYLGS